MPKGQFKRGLTLEQRFLQYVDKNGPEYSNLGRCWEWTSEIDIGD